MNKENRKGMNLYIVLVAVVLLGMFIYAYTTSHSSGGNNNQGSNSHVPSIPIEYSDVKLSAELVFWEQYDRGIKHVYDPDDEDKDQLFWWSDYAFEDNVAWPVTGMTSFYLGFKVRNLGDTSAIFGTDRIALKLWLVDNYSNQAVNTGYVRSKAGYLLLDTALAAGDNTTYYTELVEMPTLIEGSVRWYNICYGTTFENRKKIGSLVIEGALKADNRK